MVTYVKDSEILLKGSETMKKFNYVCLLLILFYNNRN